MAHLVKHISGRSKEWDTQRYLELSKEGTFERAYQNLCKALEGWQELQQTMIDDLIKSMSESRVDTVIDGDG